jgi:hypothetical protein
MEKDSIIEHIWTKCVALNISQPSQYKPNTRIGEIIENLLVENWNTFISFEKYFSACAPQLCTYSYEKRENFIFILTTLFSLFGGLTVVFRTGLRFDLYFL